MSEMIMRVARALSEADQLADGDYTKLACAAIEAMRSPTKEMCSDGADSADDLGHVGARHVWNSMIDAALR